MHDRLVQKNGWYASWHQQIIHGAVHWIALLVIAVLSTSVLLLSSISEKLESALAMSIPIIEVYPGPGVNTYQSDLYSVEVFDGSTWLPSYTYKYSRLSKVNWHWNTNPSVNFTTFGTDGATLVRITKLTGSISSVDVSPKSKNISATIQDGKATFTVNPNNKTWITVNGDDANPLFVFADEPKPAIPAGATYFGPGVQNIASTTNNHYKASSNEIIYIDGGAFVRGNIDVTGTTNVQIMGPGVLSGDLWTAEFVQALPTFAEKQSYAMIRGDWNGRNMATVKGITIVNSPFYNFWNGAANVYSVKILSPWHYSTDAFQAVNHVDQVFVFNGDNVFFPIWAGVNQDHVTVTNSFVGNTNNSIICGGFWGNSPNNTYTSLIDNVDIKTYGNPPGWGQPTPGVFQIWVDNATSTLGYSNQTYQNIRIEGSLSQPMAQLKNMVYPWGGPNVFNPPLGNSYNLLFRNITLGGTQGARSDIKGWDANNGFHNVSLDNIMINGTQVTDINVANYFDVNSYVSGMVITAPPDTTPPTIFITVPLNNASVSGAVNITASSSDNYSVSKVEFFIDGALFSTDMTAPYSVSWDTTSITTGSHSIIAKAYDIVNNFNTSSVTVTVVDQTLPTTSIISPVQNANVSGTVGINANATDDVGVSKVEFYIDGSILSTDTSDPYSTLWNTASSTLGSHVLISKAYDSQNNVGTSSGVAVIVVDLTPPISSITTPINNSTVSGTVSMSATTTDVSGISKVELYVDGSLLSTDTTAPYTSSWNTTSYIHNSNHTIFAKSYDSAGNIGTSATISVKVADITSPTTSITSPLNNATVTRSSTVTIQANASDVSGISKIEFRVNGTLKCTDTTAPYSCAWSVPQPKNVTYTLQSKAYDVANNSAVSTNVTVTAK